MKGRRNDDGHYDDYNDDQDDRYSDTWKYRDQGDRRHKDTRIYQHEDIEDSDFWWSGGYKRQ